MTYRIAICDDNTADASYVQDILQGWSSDRNAAIQVDVFHSAESFLFRYAEDKAFDILLLDIEMGGIDGVSLAKRIRQDNEAVQIIFITGFPDYIADGYDVAALHYLMKPVSGEKLYTVLDRAVSGLAKTGRVLLLPVAGEILRLPVDQVQYVEAFSHSAAINTALSAIEVKLPLAEIEQMLGDGFIRCHRSYLVGLKFISRLSRNEVILDSGKVLPLSRSAAQTVHKAFISYYTGDTNETV